MAGIPSFPAIFIHIMYKIAIYMKIDQVMIKQMLGADQVGLYAAAVRLSEVWYFIPIVITASVFPAIIPATTRPTPGPNINPCPHIPVA